LNSEIRAITRKIGVVRLAHCHSHRLPIGNLGQRLSVTDMSKQHHD
jgi:hypothetical protein